ncbi:MAG: hypothetical protein QXJ62_06225 [Nitrososphaeria archaeon]
MASKNLPGELKVYTNLKCEPLGCFRYRPIIGGLCVTKSISGGCGVAAIGYVATKPAAGSEGIVTAGHLTYPNINVPLYQWDCSKEEDKIAIVQNVADDSFKDALYVPFISSIYIT